MLFELLHAPLPDGYGESLLSLTECKRHLAVAVDSTIDDPLIEVLRDAAIEFVEGYCSVRLGPVTGLMWKAEGFPSCDTTPLVLGVSPVTDLTAVAWKDGDGDDVTGTLSDFRVTLHGEVLPAIGGDGWPGDVGGAVSITFSAGYAAGQAPKQLLHAARLFLGHLYKHREAVVSEGMAGEVPLGVSQLCSRYRRIAI